MATSNSTNFTQTRNEIIQDALYYLEVLGSEETIDPSDLQLCTRALNRIIKVWAKKGRRLFATGDAAIFLRNSVATYTLSSTGDHASATYVSTTLASAAASSASSLTVDSTTGMTVGDYIGIELDDDTRQWTTIATLPGSNVITITTPLTGAAAAANTVYTYTTRLSRPIEILSATRLNTDSLEKEIKFISREEYSNLVNKTVSSDPSLCYVDRQTSITYVSLWATPSNCKDILLIQYKRQLEDFDNAADNPDLPVEWLEALILQLAYNVRKAFGASPQKGRDIAEDLQQAIYDAECSDQESTPVRMCPDAD